MAVYDRLCLAPDTDLLTAAQARQLRQETYLRQAAIRAYQFVASLE